MLGGMSAKSGKTKLAKHITHTKRVTCHSFSRKSMVNSPSWRAPIVGTNPTLASGGMAFLAERMAAMVLETAMPDLTAGIADALILDGKWWRLPPMRPSLPPSAAGGGGVVKNNTRKPRYVTAKRTHKTQSDRRAKFTFTVRTPIISRFSFSLS